MMICRNPICRLLQVPRRLGRVFVGWALPTTAMGWVKNSEFTASTKCQIVPRKQVVGHWWVVPMQRATTTTNGIAAIIDLEYRMKNWTAVFVLVVMLLSVARSPLYAVEIPALKGGEKIIFFGDSITQSGGYINYFEAYLLTRFP